MVENLVFLDSPCWTVNVHRVDGLEVRDCEISARRTDDDHHGIVDITAFNTDGFDVTGRNVWIHDCVVWNQDDCIAVKVGSQFVYLGWTQFILKFDNKEGFTEWDSMLHLSSLLQIEA